MIRKFFALLIIFTFLIPPGSVFAQAASDVLNNLAVNYYNQGYYQEALHEFSKVLLIEPDNAQALFYVRQIRGMQGASKEDKVTRALDEYQGISKVVSPTFMRDVIVNRELDKRAAAKKPPKYAEAVKYPGEAKEKKDQYVEMKGEYQVAGGVRSPGEAIWKEANGDLNERNYRILFTDARYNTYDPAVYDRFRLDLDTKNLDKLGINNINAHTNITVDPWSFTGKTDKFTIPGVGGDSIALQLKYWSNTGKTINEIVNTLSNGDAIALPEIKVIDERTSATAVKSTFNNTFNIPSEKIIRDFMPVRELWFDYKDDETSARFFPMAYGDQALTTKDPLMLSNRHTWWEESPWLAKWRPGNLNTGATPDDFSKGIWDNSLGFFTRDSDNVRLTSLRGLAFKFNGVDANLESTLASPKTLWDDYDSFTTYASATRLSYDLMYNLNLGLLYAGHFGYNEKILDGLNNVFGFDFKHEPFNGTKILGQVASSQSTSDRTTEQFTSRKSGNAYFFSLVNRFPTEDIYTQDYEAINKGPENSFVKSRWNFAHMDTGFESSLASYRQTRDDEFWSRHISFRKHPLYLYTGLTAPMNFYDIKPFAIGDGIDFGRDVISWRLEGATKVLDRPLIGLFDVRNVHNVKGGFIENVARVELTYDVNDKVTGKFFGLRQDMPKTQFHIDPFIFDPVSGQNLINNSILGGEDPSLKTLSFGFEYKATDQVSLNAVYEITNDSTVATDNYPRGLFNSASFTTVVEDGKVYRVPIPFLYSQQFFDLPPYDYFDVYKGGVSYRPWKELEFYLDCAYNANRTAGQIDDNMNHVGLEIAYEPTPKLSFLFKYTASRWLDLLHLNATGQEIFMWHNNIYFESRYHLSQDAEFIFDYGVGAITPLGSRSYDPFGGSLAVLDTQHIVRLYYKKKF